jgi:hypothetical protein
MPAVYLIRHVHLSVTSIQDVFILLPIFYDNPVYRDETISDLEFFF